MATYKDIINEFETIANAFDSVNYFIYNRVSEINGRIQDKADPLLLVKSTPNTNRGSVNNDFLPSRKEYSFNIFLYNTRDTNTQKTKSLQESQSEVDLILDQYIAEFIRRNISGDNGFSLVDYNQINGFLAHDVHNAKLVQSTYSLTIALDSSCSLGTFNY